MKFAVNALQICSSSSTTRIRHPPAPPPPPPPPPSQCLCISHLRFISESSSRLRLSRARAHTFAIELESASGKDFLFFPKILRYCKSVFEMHRSVNMFAIPRHSIQLRCRTGFHSFNLFIGIIIFVVWIDLFTFASFALHIAPYCHDKYLCAAFQCEAHRERCKRVCTVLLLLLLVCVVFLCT